VSEVEVITAFMDLVCDGGTPVATCDLCKTTWFQADGDYMEPDGEIERLLEKQRRFPEKYRAEEIAPSVSYGHAFGLQFIWRCHCAEAQRFILGLWSERSLILKFIAEVNEAKAQEAQETATALAAATA
jgi:hypothetical protein